MSCSQHHPWQRVIILCRVRNITVDNASSFCVVFATAPLTTRHHFVSCSQHHPWQCITSIYWPMCLLLIVRYIQRRPNFIQEYLLCHCRYELNHSEYVSKLPKGKHSTKGNYTCNATKTEACYCIVPFRNIIATESPRMIQCFTIETGLDIDN